MTAIAAVDMALWDIKGKALKTPVYYLLGGRSRDRVLVYGHANGSDIEQTIDAVAEYRDMLVIFRDRVQAMINAGATLQQVKAARLTADYDPRFGATNGTWTTDMFVEAVYTSLKNPPKK